MNRQPSEPPESHEEPGTPEAALVPEDARRLEAELEGLSLRGPSDMLDARISASLLAAPTDAPRGDTDAPVPAGRGWLTGLAVAAAVALVAAAGLAIYLRPGGASSGSVGPDIVDRITPNSPQTPGGAGPEVVPAAHRFDPEPIELRWSRDLDAGTMKTAEGRPVQAIRRQDVVQHVWVDAERGITIQFIQPREQLVLSKQNPF